MEGGVVVRSCGLELCRTGINHFVAGQDSGSLSLLTDFVDRLLRYFGDGAVGKTHLLRPTQEVISKRHLLEKIFHIGDGLYLPEEPLINLCNFVYFIDTGDTTAEGFGNNEDSLVVYLSQASLDSLPIPVCHEIHLQAMNADFQRADSL